MTRHHRERLPASSIGIIGESDGPTAIYVVRKINPIALAFTVGALFGITISFFAAVSVHKKKNG